MHNYVEFDSTVELKVCDEGLFTTAWVGVEFKIALEMTFNLFNSTDQALWHILLEVMYSKPRKAS